MSDDWRIFGLATLLGRLRVPGREEELHHRFEIRARLMPAVIIEAEHEGQGFFCVAWEGHEFHLAGCPIQEPHGSPPVPAVQDLILERDDRELLFVLFYVGSESFELVLRVFGKVTFNKWVLNHR
jgi:hypothetical protein